MLVKSSVSLLNQCPTKEQESICFGCSHVSNLTINTV